MGLRRLKSSEIVLEWIPQAGPLTARALVAQCFAALVKQGVPVNTAAGQAVVQAKGMLAAGLGSSAALNIGEADHFVVALSLAEAETVRRLIHVGHACLSSAGVRLLRTDGAMLDQSEVTRREGGAIQFIMFPTALAMVGYKSCICPHYIHTMLLLLDDALCDCSQCWRQSDQCSACSSVLQQRHVLHGH